ncbi:jg5841 [Pararge aegeria aegeria]|uniref:Jg5841 protein n=1 Tax=Pararge aegeria aegeria TaxID=348720 RepID=A0A8S4SK70_9NEOP|nr:jg5841 [Pararge aegeria aegeria]
MRGKREKLLATPSSGERRPGSPEADEQNTEHYHQRDCAELEVRAPGSRLRRKKKRILLSTTTKGLVQRYLSTHLDSSSRLDPNRSYWRAPLSPRASGTGSGVSVASDKEGDGHLSCRVASHWAGPRQGVSLRCA